MSKILFNEGWEFAKSKIGTKKDELTKLSFKKVSLPHDWLIYQGNDLYEDGTGWYRKKFTFAKSENRRTEVYFEGVYMDSTVFVNGEEVGQWKYGYSSFFFDITEYLVDGENEILVQINHQSPNSRWYSGAGIYRDVYLMDYPYRHIVTDSLYISAKPVMGENETIQPTTDLSKDWEVIVSAQLSGEGEKEISINLPEWGISRSLQTTGQEFEASFVVTGPKLWSLEKPSLYHCNVTIGKENEKDEVSSTYGFRSFTYDCSKGLFVNGVHTKINGVCEHHDLGALGSAFSKTAMRRKLNILRGMGVNAIRTSHNMPAPDLLDLTDEMGFLVMDEAFDMWESSKTTYDYGRFFKEWWKKDVESWVKRDRNHPSIFMWSIGNEIYDTHKDEHGMDITRMLAEGARSFDPRENAVIGMGSNYMPWENTQKCADILKFAGYNYGEKYYDEHHKKYPDWFMFGSETSSTVQSRGIYHFPYKQSVLADDDWQCSSLGNSTTSWGAKSSEYCIIAERDHEFSLGQFLWTGFDYIGEPTPYQTRNSYFGQIDTCGFPKDSYYIYKSAWTDYRKDPFVHVFPHWDFNPGQLIDVRIASNAPCVELLVNGKSLGRKQIDHQKDMTLTGDWQVPYEKGVITGIAFDENGAEIARESRYSYGEGKRLVVKRSDQFTYDAEQPEDYVFLEVGAEDEEGHPVENASNTITVSVTRGGELAGVDNGDSTDTDEYKGNHKRLFSGKMLVIAKRDVLSEEMVVELTSPGMEGVQISITAGGESHTKSLSCLAEEEAPRIRKIELEAAEGNVFKEGCNEIKVKARIYPESAEKSYADSLQWKVVTDAGIESPLAKVTVGEKGTEATVKALGDGTFRLRCSSNNGTEIAKVISELEFTADGLGVALLNPYSFIYGGIYNYNDGEMGNGNDHGVATPRGERAVVGFEEIDFGSFGSDEITVSLFCLSSAPYPFEIWEGIPGAEGSSMLLAPTYQKETIWNVYQPETYKLPRRVKGVTNLYFVTFDKAHLGGFSFKKLEKAYEKLTGGECSRVYGDSFLKGEASITGIGNNVTVEYADMDFGANGPSYVEIGGSTGNEVNTIHLLFTADGMDTVREIVEFRKGEPVQRFEISAIKGNGLLQLVFLPGSDFNLDFLHFSR